MLLNCVCVCVRVCAKFLILVKSDLTVEQGSALFAVWCFLLFSVTHLPADCVPFCLAWETALV